MKRPVALLLSAVILCGLTCATACAPTAKGTEGAKLLLARDRLQAEQLRQKMAFLPNDAKTVATSEKSDGKKTVPLSKTSLSVGDGLSYDDKGFAKDGDTYVWTQFPDSNHPQTSIRFYQSYFTNMEHFAERTAETIDRIKTGVKQTDVWVEIGDSDYMLTVNAGTETLFSRSDDELSVCKRYVNVEGDVVYERYVKNDVTQTGFLLIPEKRYEYYNNRLFIAADNERGYWNMMYGSFNDYEDVDDLLSVHTLSMFDDVTVMDRYQFEGETMKFSTENGTFSTANLARDIISISPSDVTMHLCALNGISAVTAVEGTHTVPIPNDEPATYEVSILKDVDANDERTRYEVHDYVATLHTQSDATVTPYATYLDGRVQVFGTKIEYIRNAGNDWNEDYRGELSIKMPNETLSFEETLALTLQFLDEVGLSLKDDPATLLAGKQKLDGMQNYYSWRDVTMDSIDAIREYQTLIQAEFSAHDAALDAVQDAEVIQETFFPVGGIAGDFAPLSLSGYAAYENGGVRADNLAASVKSHALLEKETVYAVELGVAKRNANGWIAQSVIPLTEQTATAIPYAGGTLSLSWTGSGKLPTGILSGEYAVVAYVVTADGIRISQLQEVAFNQASNATYELPYSTVLGARDGNALSLTYKELHERTVHITVQQGQENALTEIENALRAEAAKHGLPKGEVYSIDNPDRPTFALAYEKTVNGETVTGHVVCIVTVEIPPNDNELPTVPIA